METTWPCVVEMPDLSDLAAGLLGAWFLHATFIESFPPGRAAFLSSSFVCATEHTLRQYQEARNRLERASREEALMEFLRGCNDLEFACIGLAQSDPTGGGVDAFSRNEGHRRAAPAEQRPGQTAEGPQCDRPRRRADYGGPRRVR